MTSGAVPWGDVGVVIDAPSDAPKCRQQRTSMREIDTAVAAREHSVAFEARQWTVP